MTLRSVSSSRWWLPILAFLAGFALHAAAAARRPQAPVGEPRTIAASPGNSDGGAGIAHADSDTLDLQLD